MVRNEFKPSNVVNNGNSSRIKSPADVDVIDKYNVVNEVNSYDRISYHIISYEVSCDVVHSFTHRRSLACNVRGDSQQYR
jgi:hypothetical protein